MKSYYGVIYYKDGHKEVTGGYIGGGADMQCERATALRFEEAKKWAVSPMFEPTRFEVKEKNN